METIYFMLGVASVLSIILFILSGVVTIKIIKINKKLEKNEYQYKENINKLYVSLDNLHNECEKERGILKDNISETFSYIDSRVDKLLNDPKFCLNK
jgi:hypothetical protein